MNVVTQPTKHGPGGSAVRRADVPARLLVGVNLRVAEILTALIVGLAALASAGGLFLPGLYRDTTWTVPQNQGQDLVTLLLAVPALGLALLQARRGSTRATLAWIGLLGYMLYTYAGAAYAYYFNAFFLIYVSLFSLSIFAVVAAVTGLDVAALQERFDAATPRRAAARYLGLLGLVLTALWVGQILPFFVDGTLPELAVRAAAPTVFVFVQDLGLIVPLALLAARWLGRDAAWGYLLAGCILIKATTMGLALVSMTWFAWRAGQHVDLGLALVWGVLAGSGLGMTIWFLRHARA